MMADFWFKNRNLKHTMLNILKTNEDILMKLSVDLSYDVIVKFSWLHGRGTKSMVATPTLLRAMPLSNTLLKPQQKIKIFQKFFLHVFTWSQKLQKDIYNIFLSVILRDLKNFPGTFQSILFQVSLYHRTSSKVTIMLKI